ncbi:MAG: hypothetical protein Ct9H300mP1_18140 [Planctomycetaceae bacterium]|nr:MAG: hypothetical protein Ct9H300mP1_18140 [Planctomycetaceae bacterium]
MAMDKAVAEADARGRAPGGPGHADGSFGVRRHGPVGRIGDHRQGRTAQLKLDMPENLTTWTVRAWAMGHGTNVGEGTASVLTTKNVLVRLQAPRFFTEKDEVVFRPTSTIISTTTRPPWFAWRWVVARWHQSIHWRNGFVFLPAVRCGSIGGSR